MRIQLRSVLLRHADVGRLYDKACALTRIAASPVTGKFTCWTSLPIDSRTRRAIEAARKANPGQELVIGRFDDDGKLYGVYGELPLGLQPVSRAGFVARYRFPVDIVLTNDKVLVRKDFRGDWKRFVREWYALAVLSGRVNVPAIACVDEERCLIYKDLLLGRKIRDILIDAGARIRDVDIERDPELQGLDKASMAEAISARARAYVPSCLTETFLCVLEDQMKLAHSLGITNFGFTIGNVIVDPAGKPYFFDFDGATIFESRRSLHFLYRVNQDRRKFNRYYGPRLATSVFANFIESWLSPV